MIFESYRFYLFYNLLVGAITLVFAKFTSFDLSNAVAGRYLTRNLIELGFYR
jgi:hypothetical protein